MTHDDQHLLKAKLEEVDLILAFLANPANVNDDDGHLIRAKLATSAREDLHHALDLLDKET